MDKTLKCIICKDPITTITIGGWAYGYDAAPIAEGRCCGHCKRHVDVARLRLDKWGWF